MASSDAVIDGVAGALGAVISLAATYPLITVSTLRALDRGDVQAQLAALEPRAYMLPSPLRELVQYSRTRGWRALFAGLKPAVAATAVSQGIYFYVYAVLRQVAVARKRARSGRALSSVGGSSAGAVAAREEISVVESLVVAGAAGCVNVLATNPLWVVITQMQALQRADASVAADASALHVARMLYRDSGARGFFKGLAPSLLMVVNPTIQYILYEWLTAHARASRSHSSPHGKAAALTGADVFAMSATAKIGATLVTYPMLVVKNRLQSINRHTHEDMRYAGVWHAIAEMARSEGLAGFYRGLSVKLLQTVLAAALLMTLKEEIFAATRAALAPAKPARG